MKDNEYKCYVCEGIFEFGISDEEATEELNENFPDIEKEDCGIVCDNCYKKMEFGG